MISIQPISNLPVPRLSSSAGVTAVRPGFSSQVQPVAVQQGPALSSDRERWNKTKQEVLELFSQNPEPDALVKAIRTSIEKAYEAGETKIKGVEIFDGSKPGMEWVNDLCKQRGSIFTHVPPSTRWDMNEKIQKGLEYVLDYATQSAPDEATRKAESTFFKLLVDKKIGVFLSPEYVNHPWALKHELIHVLQNKNGLHSGSKNPDCDLVAMDFIDQFQQYPVKSKFVQNMWRLLRVADTYVFSLPMALIFGVVTGRFFKAIRNRHEETPGKAVRRYAEREMEVDKMFITHGAKLGVPFSARIEHVSHFFFESFVQYLRSFELDWSRNMGMPQPLVKK